MALQPFTKEQLNYFKFAFVVLNEFPKALRQTFKQVWNNTFGHLPSFQPWDDSMAVRNMFLATEGGKTKVPTNFSYNEWDCTALFQATIFARSFALPDSAGHHKTLSDLYVKPHKLPHGKFHASVRSPSGDDAETFAMAIDQLRLLRNAFCHSSSSTIDKPTFDQYIQLTKDALDALGVTTDPVDAVGGLTEADFPTQRVRTLEDDIRKELQAESAFLKEDVKDELIGIRSGIAQSNQERQEDVEQATKERKEIQELQDQLGKDIKKELQAESTFLKKDVKDELSGIRSDIAQSNQERQEDVERAARERKKIQELQNQLGKDIKKELQAESKSLKEGVKDELSGIRSDIAQSNQVRQEDVKRAARERKELRELQNQLGKDIKKELQAESTSLKEGVKDEFRSIRSDIAQSNQERHEDVERALRERNEEFQELKNQLEFHKEELKEEMSEKVAELSRKVDEVFINKKSESKSCLPRSCLPSKVPNFTGREKECDEVIGHVTSESTRLISVWGSPGFGKTSIAIAVGHHLQAQGLPVYFLSLRGLKSKSDLTSKLLGLFRQSTTLQDEQFRAQRLSADDELCSIFDEIVDRCVIILDNSDDLFESGMPNVKEEVVNLIGEILNRSDKVTFLLTTRESLRFLDLRFQGHQAVKIRELDEFSSQNLVGELLPQASTSDCKHVAQICGSVPLAMKLLCSSVSEDCSDPSQCIDEFMESTENIVEMLDNPDYPSDQRLKSLFDASFQRLSTQEKEALVSISVLPEQFDAKIAAAILGIRRTEAAKMLKILQRKSLIDSGSKSEKFSFHKLLQTLAREKGELEMKETVLNSTIRFKEFYIALFEKLNENFLTGHSMLAFIEFFEVEQNIVQNLIDACLEPKTVDRVFDVLLKAKLFLAFLYRSDEAMFNKIYDSAITAANPLENHFYKGLLYSKAFGAVAFGETGKTKQLLSEDGKVHEPTSVCDREQSGKHLVYNGISQLVLGKVEDGVKCLEEAVSSIGTNSENAILKIIVFQILTLYYSFRNDTVHSSLFYKKALQECRHVGDAGLLVIPKFEGTAKESVQRNTHSRIQNNTQNQPLQLAVIFLVSQAVAKFSTNESDQCFCNLVSRILQDSETALPKGTTGSFNYNRTGVFVLTKLCKREDSLSVDEIIAFSSKADQGNLNNKNYSEALESCKRELAIKLKLFGEERAETANSYHSLGITQHSLGNYTSAAESAKRALAIRLKVFGEEHSETATSYHSLATTQHSLEDYTSAAESMKRALAIRLKVFGEGHPETANSYHSLGNTQHSLADYTSAAESDKRALAIRLKVFGEEHPKTADSYHSLAATQHSLEDYTSAAESAKRALAIRLKVFGEKHPMTAGSYHELGITQHSLGDFTSAAESHRRAFAIRLKVFGEEHPKTADSYHELGITQHSLEEYTSAAESKKRALAIRLKVFGEEHPKTADSYHSLATTQHSLADYTSAAESDKRAFAIRLKVFGEEHSETAESYHELGITQHSLEEYTSAGESKKRALAIRLKVFGEEHPKTADSYHSLGITQHSLEDYTSTAESMKRALAIRLKVFGEGHPETADSYHSLGITQHSLADYTSAAESHKRALAIRLKVFGEEHPETADSYHSLATTQHSLGDYTSAAESKKRALAIRLKVFGEEHPKTADSYYSLATTQHSLGDYTSAAESLKRALNIRLKVFGEEHAETANSYFSLGVTQHSLGDYTSAAESAKRALAIRLKVFGEEHPETAYTRGLYISC
ncbi:hypothetical protein ACROYT_G002009 [Oculina patagonica]